MNTSGRTHPLTKLTLALALGFLPILLSGCSTTGWAGLTPEPLGAKYRASFTATIGAQCEPINTGGFIAQCMFTASAGGGGFKHVQKGRVRIDPFHEGVFVVQDNNDFTGGINFSNQFVIDTPWSNTLGICEVTAGSVTETSPCNYNIQAKGTCRLETGYTGFWNGAPLQQDLIYKNSFAGVPGPGSFRGHAEPFDVPRGTGAINKEGPYNLDGHEFQRSGGQMVLNLQSPACQQ